MKLAQLVPAARGARIVLGLVLAAVVLGLLWFGIDRVFYAPGRAKVAVAAAKSDAIVATGESNKAADARAVTESIHEITRTIERQTITNERTIRAAQGAGDLVGIDVDRAGRAALCLRKAYVDAPVCAETHSAVH